MPAVDSRTRSARLMPELGPADPVELAAAPSSPEPERGWMAALLPALSALGMVGFALLSPNVWIIALCGGVAMLSAAAAVWSARSQRRRSKRLWAVRRARYLTHLSACITVLEEAAHRQREYALAAHPDAAEVLSVSPGRQLWERRPGHDDCLRVRLGVGRMPARRVPHLQGGGGDPDGDPELLTLAAHVVARHSSVDGLPVALELAATPAAVVSFDQLAHLRAVVVSLTRSHGPDLIRLHALGSPAEVRWLTALPQSDVVAADVDPADAEQWVTRVRQRLRDVCAAPSASSLLTRFPAEPPPACPQVVVLAGDREATIRALSALRGALSSQPAPVAVLAFLADGGVLPAEITTACRTDPDGGCTVTEAGARPHRRTVTHPDLVSYTQARRFAESLAGYARPPAADSSPSALLLSQLLGGQGEHPLRIPMGQDDDGLPVSIDFREAARGGDGPHGLVIGRSGTGKSELLRSLLISAAYRSPPQELAFLLVDFKGGAAFTELAGLPHTAGLVTNLDSDAHEIARLCASLRAELRRRQRILRAAGVDDIDRLPQPRRKAPDAAAADSLPRLIVVVDEYAELIEQSPDVLDVLMSLGRLGRSLGIHLLLASQRLDDGRLRGLDAHLRFRICLRTSSTAESVAVIGSPHAAGLPSAPGWAWLQCDASLTKVRVALADPAALAAVPALRSARARPVCLPPLPERLALQCVPRPVTVTDDRARWVAAVGLMDLPELGEQRPLTLDLSDAAGHLAVVGAPRSGRSTALTSVVMALAESTPPALLAIHLVTSAASPLAGTGGLPHVGTVATTAELAARVIGAVADAVDDRHASTAHDQAISDRILLVVDDVGAASRCSEAAVEQLAKIANTGLAVGVSLAVSCHRWTDLRGGLREAIGAGWELRLNDASDSVHPHLARRMTRAVAGRVLTSDGVWAQIAVPGSDGVATMDLKADALADLVATVARRGGAATRPVQLLPSLVPAHSLPDPSAPGKVPIGVGGIYGDPLEIGLGAGEHLVVLGNSGSGRSGLLRAVADAVAAWDACLWLVDPRRTLTSVPAGPYSSVEHPDGVCGLIQQLVDHLESSDRRTDTWAPIRRIHNVLLIDDLELAAGRGGSSSFASLAELLPHAAELGLSVVTARRLSGSSRAAFDPFFGRLLELGETGIVLSGDPGEGPVLGGLRPRRRPPGRGQLVLHGEPAGEIQAAWRPDGVQKPRFGRSCVRTVSAHNPQL